MGGLKGLILPAIVAITLHGLLFISRLPKQQSLKPVLEGLPIEIEINAFSPKVLSPKREEEIKEEITPKAEPPQKTVQKQIVTPPSSIPQQREKKVIEPEQTKKKVHVINKDKDIVLQKQPRKDLVKVDEQLLAHELLDEPIATQETAGTFPDHTLSKKEITRSPIQTKAIPIYRRNQQPNYPLMAKKRGYEGAVLLNVLVDAEGRVSEVNIKHSSGHVSLDRAALQTVRNWLFVPATEGQTPVAMWVDIPIDFRLK